MATPFDVSIDLYKAKVGSAWHNLQANYFETAEANGLMPKLIDFYKSRTEVLKQFGGQTILTVLNRQAAYWDSRKSDPKYDIAVGFYRQYGYAPNLFEVDSGISWFVGSIVSKCPPGQVWNAGTNKCIEGEENRNFFSVVQDWVEANPLLASGIAVGGFLILTRRLRL